MAMTREEEKELRLNCSIGTLLSRLESRPDLIKEPPPKEETEEVEGGVKRSAEDQGGKAKKAKDEEEARAIEYFLEESPDYDEDDPDWVIEEKKYLIEEYGKKTVTLHFDDRDRFIYTCEICNVECNQRKMLDAHCLGMKHLRKKKLHDLKIQGKEVPDTYKISRSTTAVKAKPTGPIKPDMDELKEIREAKKRKWEERHGKQAQAAQAQAQGGAKVYYNYGQGGNPPYQQPPPYGPPPAYSGAPPPFPPPTAPPPGGYYGQWGANPPNIFNTPPPNLAAPTQDATNKATKNSLAGGDTGSLLQRLADCAVKNDKDSDLAINVVIALMKSLKDFNHKRGETKFIEVLTEADVTFRILKTLKPMNKGDDVSSPVTSAPEALQDQNSSSSTTCGVSDFAQAAPNNNSQPSNYPADNQYYNNQSNPPSNANYNYGSSEYPNPVPTGCPPPSATAYNNVAPVYNNSRGTNGYAPEGTDPNYGQNTAYPNQGPANTSQTNQNYPTQNYSHQGYGSDGTNNQNYANQGYGNQGTNAQAPSGYGNQGTNTQAQSGYYNQGQAPSQDNSGYSNQGSYSQNSGEYYKGPQSTQTAEDTSSTPGGLESGESNPAPVAPTTTATPASDSSTPDFSNYGYAAGYSMWQYR